MQVSKAAQVILALNQKNIWLWCWITPRHHPLSWCSVCEFLSETRRRFCLKISANLWLLCSSKLGLTSHTRWWRRLAPLFLPLSSGVGEDVHSAAIKAAARQGKWQVSWCLLPLISALVCEESDRNKAQVNKAGPGQRQSGLVSVSDPCGSLHSGTGDQQRPACSFTGAELSSLLRWQRHWQRGWMSKNHSPASLSLAGWDEINSVSFTEEMSYVSIFHAWLREVRLGYWH